MVLVSKWASAAAAIAVVAAASASPAVAEERAPHAAPAALRNGALQLPAGASNATAEELLAGDAAAWSGATEMAVALQRTPPLYEGDPVDDGARPAAAVAAAHAAGAFFLRLRWDDASRSEPLPPEKLPDAGDESIYKAHSRDISGFADAACVMVPKRTGEQAPFPSLMMGDVESPVDLYYWNLARGFERLEAKGRATTTRTGRPFPGAARRTVRGWEIVLQLPDLEARTPVSFAIWDGAAGHRDGLKYFTVWYEVGP
jgi:DMSO reductase family type II enzyme heme b subunit